MKNLVSLIAAALIIVSPLFVIIGARLPEEEPLPDDIVISRTETIDISSESVQLLEERNIDISEKMTPVYETAAELAEPVIDISEDNREWEWYDRLRETDYLAEPLYYDGAFDISESERDLIERTVMHETGWCEDYRLLILVAQCIRNGCERFNQTPEETFENFGYAAMSYANPRAKKAVSDVFDKGLKCVENDIFCYYNSTMVDSAWHEEQRLAIDIDGNRFFY